MRKIDRSSAFKRDYKRIKATPSWQKLKSYTWIPMPPSKVKTDSQYDDRLWQVLLTIKKTENSLDIRELLLAKSSREAAHNHGAMRPKVDDHLNNFMLDDLQKESKLTAIILFDDVITSGAHFKAAQNIIQEAYLNVSIIGLFVARNVKENKK